MELNRKSDRGFTALESETPSQTQMLWKETFLQANLRAMRRSPEKRFNRNLSNQFHLPRGQNGGLFSNGLVL